MKRSNRPTRLQSRSQQTTAVIQLAGPTLTVWIYESAMGAAAVRSD